MGIRGRSATKSSGLHVFQPVHFHPPRNRQLTTPTGKPRTPRGLRAFQHHRGRARHGNCQEGSRAQLHRRPGSTTQNTARRVQTRPPASSLPGSGNTGPSGAPPTPRHTNPADAELTHADAQSYPDRHHQRPAPRHRTPPRPQHHREPQSPGSGNTQCIGTGGPSAGPCTS